MRIRCEGCGALFQLDERLLKGAKTARAECRKCGAAIVVSPPEAAPAAAPGPVGPAPPAATPPAGPARAVSEDPPLLAEEDVVGEIESQATLERFLASICEPDAEGAPLPDVPPRRFEKTVRFARPAAPVRKGPDIRPKIPAAQAGEPRSDAPGEAAEGSGNLLPFPKEAAVAGASPAAVAGLPPARPKEPERPAPTKPSYTVSRSVVLDPEKLADNRCVAFFTDAPELEPYRVLRTRILQAAERKGGNTVMITSALPLEGKTLTAVNLALTFSKAYLETALLVDCDLRQQRVREVMGFDSDKGLGDYLTVGCAVSDMMVWPGVEKLTLISGGRKVSEGSELLGSPAMKALAEDLKGRYPNRYIFFDVPPVLTGADALAFAPLVDHILFVVRAGATPIPEVQRALGMLPREKVIGLVLNRQEGL